LSSCAQQSIIPVRSRSEAYALILTTYLTSTEFLCRRQG